MHAPIALWRGYGVRNRTRRFSLVHNEVPRQVQRWWLHLHGIDLSASRFFGGGIGHRACGSGKDNGDADHTKAVCWAGLAALVGGFTAIVMTPSQRCHETPD
jgi:hypothetical protein